MVTVEEPRDPAKADSFALQEYTALRAEILLRISGSQALERNALIAAGVIAGFLYLHPPHGWQRIAWLLPVLITVFGFLRTVADEQVFRLFGDYIEKYEAKVFDYQSGWELYRRVHPPLMFGRGVDGFWRAAFWGGFFLASALVAYFGITAKG